MAVTLIVKTVKFQSYMGCRITGVSFLTVLIRNPPITACVIVSNLGVMETSGSAEINYLRTVSMTTVEIYTATK